MRKIYLVDDDKELRNILKDYLTAHEFEVTANATGHNVVEEVKQFGPDGILLDVNLPGICGFDILRDLRSNPLTSFIPIIMLTGKNDPDSQIEGLSSGANDYVLKPFDINVLYVRILNLLKNNLDKTRTKFDQINLLNHLAGVYARRNYEIYSKLTDQFENHPEKWQGYVPDLIIIKKNKIRAFLLESSQSILEESFLKRLEEMNYMTCKEEKPEANLIVRSKDTQKKCLDIIRENGFNVKIKIVNKRKRHKKNF